MQQEVEQYIAWRKEGMDSKSIQKKLHELEIDSKQLRLIMRQGELQYLESIEQPSPKAGGSRLALKSLVLLVFVGILTLIWAGYAYVSLGALVLLWLLLRNTKVLGRQKRAPSLFDKSDPF